jgi:hypothetical protein
MACKVKCVGYHIEWYPQKKEKKVKKAAEGGEGAG